MNSKHALRVVVLKGVAMVPKICISLSLMVPQPCRHFFHIFPCSFLHLGNTILFLLLDLVQNILWRVGIGIIIHSCINDSD